MPATSLAPAAGAVLSTAGAPAAADLPPGVAEFASTMAQLMPGTLAGAAPAAAPLATAALQAGAPVQPAAVSPGAGAQAVQAARAAAMTAGAGADAALPGLAAPDVAVATPVLSPAAVETSASAEPAPAADPDAALRMLALLGDPMATAPHAAPPMQIQPMPAASGRPGISGLPGLPGLPGVPQSPALPVASALSIATALPVAPAPLALAPAEMGAGLAAQATTGHAMLAGVHTGRAGVEGMPAALIPDGAQANSAPGATVGAAFADTLGSGDADRAAAAAPSDAAPAALLAMTGAAPAQPAVPRAAAVLDAVAMPADPGVGFDDAFGARIAWMADQKLGHAELRVSPEAAGPIDIRLHVDGTRIRAEFNAVQPDTRAALEASMPRLRDMLGQHGLQLAQADVGQRHAGAGPGGAPAGAEAAQGDGEPSAPLAPPPVLLRSRGLLDAYA